MMGDLGLDMLNDETSETELERAISALPPEKGVAVGRIAMKHQMIDPRDPVGLLLDAAIDVEAMSQAAAVAATSAGQAAQSVQASVASIPAQIYQGAVRAGDEIKGNLVKGIRDQGVEVGQALKMLIDSASQAGATSLKAAASDLDVKVGKIPADVQKALDAYKEKGVSEFAKAAQVAGTAAAQASLLAQISRSALVSVLAFIFATLVGAGGLWGYLLITHRVMPAGVVAMADPLRGGDLLIVPTGGAPIPASQCPGGLCLIYKKGSVPDLP